MADTNWYVIHTFSGHEGKVKAKIDKKVENKHLEDQIVEVKVPMEDVVEIKDGVKKVVQRKVFPGYVLINMNMNDETWYLIRNTYGVTSFVGPGSKPVPLTEDEVRKLGAKKVETIVPYEVGDMVTLVDGPWQGTVGAIKKVDGNRQTATITREVFGRETSVTVGFSDIRKM